MTGDGTQTALADRTTTLCRCWRVTRRDGTVLGFTDHDDVLSFDGTTFRAADGMSARALEQTSGLSVDNGEAAGLLSDSGITQQDIAAGRYDGAKVEAWLVDWCDITARRLLFRGSLGEIERAGDAFRAELRGLAEGLNRPRGRTYQSPCDAILGDRACGVDLSRPEYSAELDIRHAVDGVRLVFDDPGHAADHFARGTVRVLSGAAAGLSGIVKRETRAGGRLHVELWQSIRAEIRTGDRVRITAGCDKGIGTCQVKFANSVNFRGFPDLPSEDWLMAYPTRGGGR